MLGLRFYLSPLYGKDTSKCGSSTNKCKTLDYALNSTTCLNINVVFETSMNKSLEYRLSKHEKIKNDIIFHFHKDKAEGENPTIYGNQQLFIEATGEGKTIDIVIHSIDLQGFSLLKVENHQKKVHIDVKNSSIVNPLDFIAVLPGTKNLQLTIQRCSLRSSWVVKKEKSIIFEYFWLNIWLENDGIENTEVEITDTKISGGRFRFKNVQSFNMTNCEFENNVLRIKEVVDLAESKIELDGKDIAIFFPLLIEEPRTVNSQLKLSASDVMQLENVARYVILNCKVRKNIMNLFLSSINSVGCMFDIQFHQNLLSKGIVNIFRGKLKTYDWMITEGFELDIVFHLASS